MKKYVLIIIFILTMTSCKDKFYENIKVVKNPNDTLVLVNKNNKLKDDFIPNNLIKLDLKHSNDEKYLKKEAALAFYKLSSDAKKLGYRIIVVSAYRSYTYQEKLFDYYVKEKGINYALNCSAKAGHSEHQTGLAIDVEGSNFDYDLFSESKEFVWMRDNAHKYGFILRYPKGKEDITGFKYEPWHYRYVGKEVAKNIYEKNITLEEYFEVAN
ncbi:MAG: D-alanyl-D-alanine carboxypeptidase family protein [Lactobacillales bacterium]|nr:D-alanyl-D-alanine carboxypeptidase family protein [Lactobacillales bacterium]